MRIRINHERSARAARAGYTMMEVLVTTVIMAVMFVSLYSGFSAGFAVIQLAREDLRATQILQEKMETIRLYTWDQINQSGFIPTNFLENFYAAGTNVSGLNYTGRVGIANAPITESYSNDMKNITITVEWSSAGVMRNRQISTFVTRNGLQNYIY